MLVNKYTRFRRTLYWLYRHVPASRVLKRTSLPLKVRKLKRRTAERARELEDAVTKTGRHPLFRDVEMETFNRCNGECGFCPVNRHQDVRPATRMDDELFRSIIAQLKALEFAGNLYLYSNNEPLLDTRIFDFLRHARSELPGVTIHLSTNGILLDEGKYREIIPHVNYLTINNYTDDYAVKPHIQPILDLARSNPDWWAKTYVVVRYEQEIMTSRGGQAPNKQDILNNTLPAGCLLPARQIVIRPDGKLSLCCNDALGTMTLGDLTEQSLADIWWSDRYTELRRKILAGRGGVDLCRHCDTTLF